MTARETARKIMDMHVEFLGGYIMDGYTIDRGTDVSGFHYAIDRRGTGQAVEFGSLRELFRFVALQIGIGFYENRWENGKCVPYYIDWQPGNCGVPYSGKLYTFPE